MQRSNTTRNNHRKKVDLGNTLNLFLIVLVAASSTISIPFIFDSFTTPKILVLFIGIAFATFSLLIASSRGSIHLNRLPVWTGLSIVLIFLGMILSVIKSDAPIMRSMYGQFGRGNGLFYYFACYFILVLIVLTHNENSKSYLIRVIRTTSWILGCYACMQQIGIDFAKLENVGPSPVVLTLGNTNFSGGLLSVLFAFVFANLLQNKVIRVREFALPLLLLVGIYFTEAVQGYLISVGSIILLVSIRMYGNLRFKPLKKVFQSGGLVVILAIVLGLFGIGPLSVIFQRATFQMRIEYWQVGFRIVQDNFWFGTGADRLYDVTPKYMSPGSLEVITSTRMDNVHNWFLNFAANYGFFALLGFLLLILFVFLKVIVRNWRVSILPNPEFPAILALGAIIVDGLVSIEQPGLGIWMYLFVGFLVGDFVFNSKSELGANEIIRLDDSKLLEKLSLSLILVFSLVATSALTHRVTNDALLRHNIQSAIFEPTNTKLLTKIQDFTRNLKSEPEYIIKSLQPLAKAGDGQALLELSKSAYDYNPNSIQTIGIRAQVLSVVRSTKSSCPLQTKLIENAPWINESIQKYLICLSIGFNELGKKKNLTEILRYHDFTFRDSLKANRSFDYVMAMSIKARALYELGNFKEADAIKEQITQPMSNLQNNVEGEQFDKLAILLNW